jgi:hypothetical protein
VWVTHLRQNGFTVEDEVTPNNLINVKRENHNIGVELMGCHIAEINGYLLEGHVPAEDIARMINDGADIAGLSVPGMPEGAPGMTGSGPFRVLAFDDQGQTTSIYSRH